MSNTRRRMDGVVTKAKLEKTVTVRIDRSYRHPLYGKVIRTNKNYLVHDEIGCHPGDIVRIVESRPISKKKRWAVQEIVRRASEADVTAIQVEAQVEESLLESETMKEEETEAMETEA
jgi:small subunit ribosomal protein S17